MTATARASSRTSRGPLLIGGGLVVVLLVLGAIAGGGDSSSSGPALSPTSTDPDGTRGLVLLLQELGGSVHVGLRTPDAGESVALLLNDGLDDADTAALDSWVRAGGTLVDADPGSSFSASRSGSFVGSVTRGVCDIDALQDVGEIDAPFVTTFATRSSEQSCFGDTREAFVVSNAVGAGHVISVGGADVFTNELLDRADNGVLAARLLLPSGGRSVAILDPNPPGSGRTTLLDLVSDRVFQAILQLGVAFVLYALWRSRRLGRPVREPQPVAIAGSQFVRAVGGLQQRSHATQPAATSLRIETRRLLSDRFGIPLNTDTKTMADIVASRSSLDRAQVAAALSDTPVLDDEALVRLSQQLDTIRQEVLDGRTR